MKRVLCYGDSNTYGYDPADRMEFSYPPGIRWTDLAQQRLGAEWDILNEGLNGRELPSSVFEWRYLAGLFQVLKKGDFFAVMLGTNDLLIQFRPDAAVPAHRMEEFLTFMDEQGEKKGEDAPAVIVMAPPLLARELDGSGKIHRESVRMNRQYGELAEKHGAFFIDTGSWGIPMSFDQVHFSAEGHRIFAERFVKALMEIQAETEKTNETT